MILDVYKKIELHVQLKFKDIVAQTQIIFAQSGRARKLRIHLSDKTFVDIWYSLDGEYSYHWEQRPWREKIYRHDNAPHLKWSKIKTFPKHFHNGSEKKVIESHISNNPINAIEEFLSFIKEQIKKH